MISGELTTFKASYNICGFIIVFMTALDFYIMLNSIIVIILNSNTELFHQNESAFCLSTKQKVKCKFCETYPAHEKAVEDLVCMRTL